MRHIVFVLFGLLSLPVYALVDVDVFSAEIVLDKSKSKMDANKLAQEEGLKQVIVKASGDRYSVDNPVIEKALERSEQYLSQLGYSDQFGQSTLKMVFNPSQIQLLLDQADLPYWPTSRPNLIVWIVQEDRYGRKILWEHLDHSLIYQIKLFADLIGLPIVIPVGDLKDVISISELELWGGFISPISMASQRYSTDAVLIIRIRNAQDGNDIRWTLYDEKPQFMVDSVREPIVGNVSGNTANALESVINKVSHYYAKKSSTKFSSGLEQRLLVQFTGVKSAKSYFLLERQLKELSVVASIHLERVVGNEVTFNVDLLGSAAEFEAEIIQNQSVRKLDHIISNTVVAVLEEDVQSPLLQVEQEKRKLLVFEWSD